jgi:hypothetical protein
MQIIIAIVFASTLIWLIYKWNLIQQAEFKSSSFCLIFALKLLFGVCFYMVYTAYYTDTQTSDMHKYYNDALRIFELTKNQPLSYLSVLTGMDLNSKYETVTQQLDFWYQEESASVINDSRLVIRFNLLLMPFSGGNIYLHLVSIVFLSFLGLTFIYLSIEPYFLGKEVLLLIACYGIPSVMFWSSGIMKEGLLVFFFGMLVYSLFHLTNITFKRVFIFILSSFGMFFAKFYVLLSLLPSLLFLLICSIFKNKSTNINLTTTCFLTISCSFAFNFFMNNLPLEKLSKKQNDFINLSLGGVYLANLNAPYDTIFTLKGNSVLFENALIEGNIAKLKTGTVYHHWKNPGYADTLVAQNDQKVYTIIKVLAPTGSAITLKRLMPDYGSILRLFPEAFVNVCFRPFIMDVTNIFSLLACLENISFIVFILLALYLYKKPNKASQIIIIFSLLFVFTLYTLVGLTTPVLGAAVRYKVPAIPFLLISLFLVYDLSKIKEILKSLGVMK